MDGVVLQVQCFLCVLYQGEAAAIGFLGAAEQEKTGVVACLGAATTIVHDLGQNRITGR